MIGCGNCGNLSAKSLKSFAGTLLRELCGSLRNLLISLRELCGNTLPIDINIYTGNPALWGGGFPLVVSDRLASHG